jgi:hypothetical protein
VRRYGTPALLFAGAAVVLGALCSRIADWAVMTDELLYERLSLSFVDGAFLPTLHGEHADVYAVLYPFLLMPVYALIDMPEAVRAVHGLNGVLFASAVVPTYFLARALRLPRFAVLASSVFAVALPWTVIGGFVMTEAAAYPAALFAVLSVYHAVVRPSVRSDLLALGAILLATLARPQLAALGVVFVLAAVAQEARHSRWREHVVIWAVAAVAVPVVLLGGAGLLGSYAPVFEEGNLVSLDALNSALQHLDVTSIALGIVPLLLGGGWAIVALVRGAAPERLAFAGIVVAAVTVLALESGSVVTRFGLGLEVKDRYLFYIAPLLFLATACALDDPRPRLVAVGVLGVTVFFVLTVGLHEFAPVFGVNVDSPASSTHEALVRLGNDLGVAPADLLAIVGGIAGAVLFVALRRWASPGLGVVVLGAVLAFAIAESAYTWNRLFESSGPSGRALTAATPESVSWVDRAAPSGSVGMLAYSVGEEWYPSAVAWWDVEFWNARVDRAYMLGPYFTYTPETFPRPRLRVDPRTGRIAGVDPPDYIVRTPLDARMRPAGAAVAASGDLELVDLEVPFRASWMTFGLDPDGWTRTERKAVLRVFGPAGQTAVKASVSSPDVETPRTASVGPATATLGSTQTQELTFDVCVPERGFADVPIRVDGETTVRAIPLAPPYSERFRPVGVRLSRIETAPTGRPCRS